MTEKIRRAKGDTGEHKMSGKRAKFDLGEFIGGESGNSPWLGGSGKGSGRVVNRARAN